MYHNCENHGFTLPEPPSHQHGPCSPVQSYPINDNCNCDEPMGWDGCCGPWAGPGGPPPLHRECTPVPPPIPPVRYVPGMNVQEQLINMAERVNVSINRWNQIQARCFQALDQVVGAAVDNSVYYSPCDVRLEDGYNENEGVAYKVIIAKPHDEAGRPIFVSLKTAYNSVSNTGNTEDISSVSFVNSAHVVQTATQAAIMKGTSLVNRQPISSESSDEVWVCGFNGHGVLRFFKGNVSLETLKQNNMVDVVGPVYPVVCDGEIFTQGFDQEDNTRYAIQAIGQDNCGNVYFISVSIENQPGMTMKTLASIMKNMRCKTAVITALNAPSDDSSRTAGTTFLGQVITTPDNFVMPSSAAFWYISRKPRCGWHNHFETEVSDIIQRMGSTNSKMEFIQGTLDRINSDELETELDNINQQITVINNSITSITTSITELQQADNEIRQEIQDTAEELTDKINEEKEQREQGDDALRAELEQEKQNRIQGDLTLESSVSTLRADSDANDAKLQAQINTIKDGSGLPIATTTKVGVIKVGRNLTVAVDGRLDAAETGLMPNDITAGDGIIIDNQAGTDTVVVSADKTVMATVEQVTTVETKVDANTEKINTNTTAIEELKTSQTEQDTKIAANEQGITDLNQRLDNELAEVNTEINSIKDGTGLPIASAERLGAIKVGANLTITEDGTLNATGGGGSGGYETVTGGTGITVTRDEDIATISLSVDTKNKLKEVDNKLDKSVYDTDKSATDSTINDLRTDITANGQDIESIQTEQATQNQEITSLKEKDTSLDGDIASLRNDLTSVDNTATDAMNAAADAEMEAKKKVDKAGDAMTGALSLPEAKLAYDDNRYVSLSTSAVVPGDQNEPGTEGEDSGTTEPEVEGEIEPSEPDPPSAYGNRATAETVELRLNVAKVDNTSGESTDVCIEGVADGVEENHAANMRQLNNVNNDLRASLDTKVSKDGDEMSGALTLPNLYITTPGGNVVGELSAGVREGKPFINIEGAGNYADMFLFITGLAEPTVDRDATNKLYVDREVRAVRETAERASTTASQASTTASSALSNATTANNTANSALTKANAALPKTGGTMTGNLIIGGTSTKINGNTANTYPTFRAAPSPSISFEYAADISGPRLQGVGNPLYNHDAANKQYVDSKVSSGYAALSIKSLVILRVSGQVNNYAETVNSLTKAAIFSYTMVDVNNGIMGSATILVKKGDPPCGWQLGMANEPHAFIELSNTNVFSVSLGTPLYGDTRLYCTIELLS